MRVDMETLASFEMLLPTYQIAASVQVLTWLRNLSSKIQCSAHESSVLDFLLRELLDVLTPCFTYIDFNVIWRWCIPRTPIYLSIWSQYEYFGEEEAYRNFCWWSSPLPPSRHPHSRVTAFVIGPNFVSSVCRNSPKLCSFFNVRIYFTLIQSSG
jgi:hypothetical protein